MKTKITKISGFAEAFESMFISKRSWTLELAEEIREVCSFVEMGIPETGNKYSNITEAAYDTAKEKFDKWLEMLLKMGRKHITLLRYIDITIMTEGLHRAGQDDVDAHARRFDNRIIRNSTRLATFNQDEFSDYYKDKVITTDTMMQNLCIDVPEKVYEMSDGYFYNEQDYQDILEEGDGSSVAINVWVKSPNGYVKEEYQNNKDVMRGLYMLGIPSNFISKINLTEWAHVFKERNQNGGANPEVKEWAESVMSQLTEYYPIITRDYVLTVEN